MLVAEAVAVRKGLIAPVKDTFVVEPHAVAELVGQFNASDRAGGREAEVLQPAAGDVPHPPSDARSAPKRQILVNLTDQAAEMQHHQVRGVAVAQGVHRVEFAAVRPGQVLQRLPPQPPPTAERVERGMQEPVERHLLRGGELDPQVHAAGRVRLVRNGDVQVDHRQQGPVAALHLPHE